MESRVLLSYILLYCTVDWIIFGPEKVHDFVVDRLIRAVKYSHLVTVSIARYNAEKYSRFFWNLCITSIANNSEIKT